MKHTNTYTFSQFHERHHKIIYKRVKPKHSEYCRMAIRRFAEFDNNGDRPIDDIRASDVHFYMDHLIQDHDLAETTANRHGVAVGKVVRYAFDNHYVKYPISIDQYDEDNARPRFFTDAEIAKILSWLKSNREAPYVYHMSLLSLHTGMRLGEILQLYEGKAKVEVDDDGFKWLWLPETKWNGKGKKQRYVPLNDTSEAAVEALEAIWDYFSIKTFYKVWGEMRHKVFGSDDKTIVFHIWRHTAATRFANDLNITSTVIGKMLGHSDLKTTNKYIKLKDDTQKQVAGMSQALGNGSHT